MKTLLLLFSILLLGQIHAQNLKTLYTNEKQVVALFFPDEIRQAVVGSSNFTFSYNKENPQHVGLLQGVQGHESNLLVITTSDNVFSYRLKYRNVLDTLSFFIARKGHIGLVKPYMNSSNQSKVSIQNDSLFGKSSDTELQNQLDYYKKFSAFHLRTNRNSLQRKKKKGMVLHLKDLIYDRNEVYLVIEIQNKSGIDFEMDYLKLFKVNGNKKKKSSYQKIEMSPIYKHHLPKLIKKGESRNFIITLPKFTFGDTEKLLLELKEYRGNRMLQLIYD